MVKNKTVAKQIVEVDDGTGVPLDGVKVAFVLPAKGAGALFADGKTYLIMLTGANGRAEAGGLRPTGKGTFRIVILAAYQGRSTSGSMQQFNFLTVAAARRAGKTPGSSEDDSTTASASNDSSNANRTPGRSTGMSAGTKALLTIAVVGGAVGAAAGAAGNKSSTSASSTPSVPACNSSSLQTQLISAFQNLVNSNCSSSATTSERSIATQYCSCLGRRLADSSQLAALELLVCINPTTHTGYTPTQAASQVCQ